MILYTVENLVELFGVDEKHIRGWSKSGVLPVHNSSPLRYDKTKIDEWVTAGNLDRHRPNVVRAEKIKGVWEA